MSMEAVEDFLDFGVLAALGMLVAYSKSYDTIGKAIAFIFKKKVRRNEGG